MTTSQSSNTTVPGPADDGEISTVALLRKIESGAIDPKNIVVAERRQLVAFLLSDGYSVAEMGQILQVGDRTVERDKKAVRESNVIARDPKLVEQMVGRLVGEAELAVQRIRRASVGTTRPNGHAEPATGLRLRGRSSAAQTRLRIAPGRSSSRSRG